MDPQNKNGFYSVFVVFATGLAQFYTKNEANFLFLSLLSGEAPKSGRIDSTLYSKEKKDRMQEVYSENGMSSSPERSSTQITLCSRRVLVIGSLTPLTTFLTSIPIIFVISSLLEESLLRLFMTISFLSVTSQDHFTNTSWQRLLDIR